MTISVPAGQRGTGSVPVGRHGQDGHATSRAEAELLTVSCQPPLSAAYYDCAAPRAHQPEVAPLNLLIHYELASERPPVGEYLANARCNGLACEGTASPPSIKICLAVTLRP